MCFFAPLNLEDFQSICSLLPTTWLKPWTLGLAWTGVTESTCHWSWFRQWFYARFAIWNSSHQSQWLPIFSNFTLLASFSITFSKILCPVLNPDPYFHLGPRLNHLFENFLSAIEYSFCLSKLPIFLGTAMFTFEGIGIVLPLENKMKSPQGMRGWNGVLNTAMIFVACLYIAVGFYGYLQFGDSLAGKGSVTLNLPDDELLANSARLVISLAIFKVSEPDKCCSSSILLSSSAIWRSKSKNFVMGLLFSPCRFILYFTLFYLSSPIFKAATKALCGISTLPNWRIRFLPAFCLSNSLRLRLMSPP